MQGLIFSLFFCFSKTDCDIACVNYELALNSLWVFDGESCFFSGIRLTDDLYKELDL